MRYEIGVCVVYGCSHPRDEYDVDSVKGWVEEDWR
jgi:hypothetical protein